MGARLQSDGTWIGDDSAAAQVFLTKEYLAIAMEYAAGGDMFQYVKHRGGLEEVEARWFFQQLIIGMDYCHKMVRPLLSCTCHSPGPCRHHASRELAGELSVTALGS